MLMQSHFNSCSSLTLDRLENPHLFSQFAANPWAFLQMLGNRRDDVSMSMFVC
jgi:hypothetical protein